MPSLKSGIASLLVQRPAGGEATFRGADGKVTDARPALAQFDDDGPAGERALSVILPPGRVAYGLAIARTPSCSADASATTSMTILTCGSR